MANVPYATVGEYIEQCDSSVRSRLAELRTVIQEAIPQAQETISWAMPTYVYCGNVLHFAAAKRHIGLYPGVTGVEMFLKKSREYPTTKGGIQFPHDRSMPFTWIADIARARLLENECWAEERKREKETKKQALKSKREGGKKN